MNSIRFRLTLTLFAGFIVLLSCASLLIFFTSKRILEKDFDARLFAQAQAVLASISQKGEALDVDWAELPQELKPHRHPHDAVQIFDSAGHVLVKDSALTAVPGTVSNQALYQNVDLPAGHFRLLTLSFLPRVEEEDVTETPALMRKSCALAVATDRSSLDHSLRKLAGILTAMTGLTSFFSLCLVWTTLRWGLRPLDALGDAVVNISPESLGQTIPVEHLPGELAPIAIKLNNLLQRLDVSFARERRFSADLSHELRTPVAELKTLSEVMLQEVGHAPEIHQAFEHTLNIARQMESLVAVLLEMVRHEEGHSALALSQVDVIPVIKAVRQKYAGKAAQKGVQLADISGAAAFGIQSEPWLLTIIFSNLFDNAIEYSPAGSRVEVEFHGEKTTPYITITNPTINLSPSDLPHIFERFWRKDKARSETHHFGIGLSLTRTLCQRLGIHLTVSMEKGSLVRFTLYLPTQGARHEN